jgi:diaminopimelate epimerase
MRIPFTKMHGAGNDFIFVDCRLFDLPDPAWFAVKYCNRWFGVGADQMLLLYPSSVADFRMDIYNADGGRVEMCGNGIRCFAKYIWDKKLSDKKVLEVETLAGIIRPERSGANVKVDMGEPIFDPRLVPAIIQIEPPVIDYPLDIDGKRYHITLVSMGNPHAVIFLNEDVSKFPVKTVGPYIEKHSLFPRRINVEFVNVLSRDELVMRVWERGSGETLACGTGASATGVAAMIKGLTGRRVTVNLLGGNLLIEWAENNRVYMTGPAEEVFEGVINYDG